jgi:hypothetical protein
MEQRTVFLPIPPLVNQTTFKQDTTTRMTTTRQRDYLNRLTSVSSSIPPSYVYDAANQQACTAKANDAYWISGTLTTDAEFRCDGCDHLAGLTNHTAIRSILWDLNLSGSP